MSSNVTTMKNCTVQATIGPNGAVFSNDVISLNGNRVNLMAGISIVRIVMQIASQYQTDCGQL